MQVINSVIHIFIIWLGYIYRTLAKWYLPWSLVEVLGRPLCVTPGLLFEFTFLSSPEQKTCANPWLSSHLGPLHLEIGQKNLPGAQAESSWYPSSCGTILKERITEADWIAALDASLFWAKEYDIELEKTTKQFGTNSSYVLTHLLVVREGLGVFSCICKSFIWISHCQQ